jgi:hypothetical protein
MAEINYLCSVNTSISLWKHEFSSWKINPDFLYTKISSQKILNTRMNGYP